MPQAESSDTIEINTPSGKKVVIRNYTTHRDDRLASEILNRGISATANATGEPVMSFSAEGMAASTAKYVELLTVSIDGEPVTTGLLDSLRTEDYQAIETQVNRITTPPKASSKS